MLMVCQKPDREGGHVTHLASTYNKVALEERRLLTPPHPRKFFENLVHTTRVFRVGL